MNYRPKNCRKCGKMKMVDMPMHMQVGGPSPKNVYTSQTELNAANELAKSLAYRSGDALAFDAHVARDIGEPKVRFIDSRTGTDFVPRPTSPKSMTLPAGVTINDVYQTSEGLYGYDDPQQGNFKSVDAGTIFGLYGRKSSLSQTQPLMASARGLQQGGFPVQSNYPDNESYQAAVDEFLATQGANQTQPAGVEDNGLTIGNQLTLGSNPNYNWIETPSGSSVNKPKTKKNPYQTLMDIGLGIRGTRTGLGLLSGAIERGRQNKYDYTQQTALGQMNPMQSSDFQPTPYTPYAEMGGNPFAYYSKYGGNLKKIMKEFSNDAHMDFGSGDEDQGMMQIGGPFVRKMKNVTINNLGLPSLNPQDPMNALTSMLNMPASQQGADFNNIVANMQQGLYNQDMMKKGGYEIDRMLVVRNILPKLLQLGRLGTSKYRQVGGKIGQLPMMAYQDRINANTPQPSYNFSALMNQAPSELDSTMYRIHFNNMLQNDPHALRQNARYEQYGIPNVNPRGGATDMNIYNSNMSEKNAYEDALNQRKKVSLDTYLLPTSKKPMQKGGLSRSQDYGSKKKPYPSVSSSDFAGGHRSYPIPTRADAVDALRLAHLHGREDVIAKVHAKYPDLKKGGNWLKGAVNPAHKGWCTPLSNPHCTGHRRAFALMMKKNHGFHKKEEGGEFKTGGLTPNKAREILHDGTAQGHPLTDKQRRFFGAKSKGHTNYRGN